MYLLMSFINLLYPPTCLLCRQRFPAHQTRQEHPVCQDCQHAMPRNVPPQCQRCGRELPGAFDALMDCATCRLRPLAFESARAPWQYAGSTQKAIQQFKYHRRHRIGQWLAQEMAVIAHTSPPLNDTTLIVSVPRHWLKRRLKGDDPVGGLASAIARVMHKPYAPNALRQQRWTTSQTHLTGPKRFRNVRQAFIAQAPLVQGQRILLIDDVLTSGATAHACALALKAAGAHNVRVLTAARTPIA